MVKVTIEGNSFKVKGTFDCGILGVFRDELIRSAATMCRIQEIPAYRELTH